MKNIDVQLIQGELQELAGDEKVKVKLNSKMDRATHIKISDKGYDIQLNPKRFRSPNKLERHLQECRRAVAT